MALTWKKTNWTQKMKDNSENLMLFLESEGWVRQEKQIGERWRVILDRPDRTVVVSDKTLEEARLSAYERATS